MPASTRQSAEESPVVRLRSPADVLTAVPYLLGFHPTDSLVAIALTAPRRRIGFVARVDLPPPEHLIDTLEMLEAPLVRERAAEALLVVYGAVTGLWPLAGDRLAALGIPVRDALRVAAGRWWSYLCDDPTCCPAEGTPMTDPTAPGGRPEVASHLVGAGLAPLPSREAMVASLQPAPAAAVDAVTTAIERAAGRSPTGRVADRVAQRAAWRRQIAAAVRASSRARPEPIPAELAANLLVALRDVPTRDAAAGWAGGPAGLGAVRLWTELTRLAPPRFVAGPATLLANAAWRRGDGALAQVAVDRARQDQPDYRLAVLMERLLNAGVRPPPARRIRPHSRR